MKFFFSLSIVVFLTTKVFVACNDDRVKIERSFFDNGNIKEVKYFKSRTDSLPYLSVSYYNSGEVKDSFFFNNKGVLDGICYFYDSKNKEIVKTTFRNGVKDGWKIIEYDDGMITYVYLRNNLLNGIQYNYDRNKSLLGTQLWLNDTAVLRREYFKHFPGDKPFDYNPEFFDGVKRSDMSSYFTEDTIEVCRISNLTKSGNSIYSGMLIYKHRAIDESSPFNNYHIMQLNDTIINGDSLKLYFKSLIPIGLDKDSLQIHVCIGGLNPDLTPSTDMIRMILKKGVKECDFYHTQYHIGYNLFLGRVDYYLGKELFQREYIFEDFNVIDDQH